MVQYLNHTEIDRKKWDECISGSRNCRAYALSWYLDTVCKNWEALVEGDYMAVMPLTARKKYGINYLFQPYFAQQLGIFSPGKISASEVENFLKAIPEKFRLIEICINTENSTEITLPSAFAGFSLKKNSNYELELNKDYQSVYKLYSENTKRNIKKAVQNGISISSENVNVKAIVDLFRKNKGAEFPQLKNDYYELIESLVKTGLKKNVVKCLGAFGPEKNLCAGAIFLIYQERAIFLFSASGEAKNNGAMFLLIDRFISEYSETIHILDFEGSNNPGLARFYKSFASKEYVYLQLKKNNLPKYIKWLKQ